MTSHERAEKICKSLRDFGDPSKSNWLKEDIAAEIEEAYAEGFRAARNKIATEIRYHCGKVENALDADKLAQRIGGMGDD